MTEEEYDKVREAMEDAKIRESIGWIAKQVLVDEENQETADWFEEWLECRIQASSECSTELSQ